VTELAPRLNPPLREVDIRAFESRFGVVLPDEYRQFLIRQGDGGATGPRYGLLPLGTVPSHWSAVHDYCKRLRRPFPLDAAWVWEDEPPAPGLQRRVNATDNGVLLVGEDGCGARWVLVVSGARAGEVWLTTGEGATPTGLTFKPWLARFAQDGDAWWASLVKAWGPSPNIWFAAHAAKQMYVHQLEENGSPPPAFAQSSPLCFDCVEFFGRACAYHHSPLAVATPGLLWKFSKNGAAKVKPRSEEM
jgi:hypothetical protein